MKKNEVKAWIKEHKKTILICSGITTVVATVVGILAFKDGKFWGSLPGVLKYKPGKDLNVSLNTGCVDYVTDCGTYLEALVSGVKVSDMGNFGKELIKKVPKFVNENTDFAVVLNTMLD